MRKPLLHLMTFGLAVCPEQAERTYMVEELTADKALLASIMMRCRNNPVELRDTPPCGNAESAAGKLRRRRMRQSLGG